MARKNRLAPAFFAYSVFGLVIGAAVGFLADTLFAAQANAQFEAHVLLYRIPTEGGDQAARDFISASLNKQGFLSAFADQHGLDTRTQKLLAKELTVVARDASSSIVELRLAGKDPVLLITTLDLLAIHMTEALRSIDESELQLLMDKLNKEIEPANQRYLELMSTRFNYGKLSAAATDEVRKATMLAEQQYKMELAHRYAFTSRPVRDELALKRQMDNLTKEQQFETTRSNGLINTDSEDYKFASILAIAEAKLRALRQAKQRLVIEFNQDTPLRVTGRALAEPIEVTSAPTFMLVLVSAFIGGLLGAIGWSLQRARNDRLTGPSIERRLGIPVLGVIPQSLTDFGRRQMRPMADTDPQRVAVSALRSFVVALHFLFTERNEISPLVFAELGKDRHAGHFIANLAVVMAQSGENVLVIDADDKQLLDMFLSDSQFAATSSLNIRDLKDHEGSLLNDGEGSIWFSTDHDNARATPHLPAAFSHFDHVLILASDTDKANNMLTGYGCGIGLILCNDKTRLSKIRKALANTLHGVVLCGYSVEESIYGGESTRT